MTIPKHLAKNVFAAIEAELEKGGWERRKPGICTLPINDDFIGWVGLNTAYFLGGVLTINPIVGVRHQLLEEVVATLSGMSPHHRKKRRSPRSP